MRSILSIPLVALVLASTTLANDAAAPKMVNAVRRHHHNIAEHIHKRGQKYNGQATWYVVDTGLEGSCGGFLNPNEFTVALNQPMYGNLDARSSWCNKKIKISANGKTATATIRDACPESDETCHHGSLDMSESLFQFFNPKSVGVFDISWWPAGDSGDDDNSGGGIVGGLLGHKNHDDDEAKAKAAAEAKKEAAAKAAKQKAEEEAEAKAERKKKAAAAAKKAEEEAAAKKKAAAEAKEKAKKAAEKKKKEAAAKAKAKALKEKKEKEEKKEKAASKASVAHAKATSLAAAQAKASLAAHPKNMDNLRQIKSGLRNILDSQSQDK